MHLPANASQDKIKVQLAIVPQNAENRALAQTIAYGIFEHLDQVPDYTIAPHGTGEMSGAAEFLIQIAPDIAFLGVAFVQPFTAKLAEQAAEKTADLIAEILKKIKKGKYSELTSNVKIQSLPGISDIDVQGPLEHTLDKTIVDLKNMVQHVDEMLLHRSPSEMTQKVEITININILRDYP